MTLGKIIFLNGASSSGKTSILMALQEMLEEPYLNAGIDKFIWMLPKRYLDPPLLPIPTTQMGAAGSHRSARHRVGAC